MSRRHPYQRIAFLAIVAACWVLGLFGLDRSRMSSFQLPIVVGAGLIGYWVVVAVRRRLDGGGEDGTLEIHEPQTCVVVRRLGELRSGEVMLERSHVRELEQTRPPALARAEPPAPNDSVSIARPVRRKPPKRGYIPLSG